MVTDILGRHLNTALPESVLGKNNDYVNKQTKKCESAEDIFTFFRMGKADNKGDWGKHITPGNQTRQCTGAGAFFFFQNCRISGKDRLRKQGNI